MAHATARPSADGETPCSRCGDVLAGPYVDAGQGLGAFHFHCLKCITCGLSVADKDYNADVESPECAPCGRGEGGGAGAAGAAAVNDMLAAGLGNVEDMLASLLGGSAAAAERVGNRSRAGTGSSAAGGDVGDGSSATPPQGPGIKLASESDVGHDSRCEFCGEIIPVEVERTVIESDERRSWHVGCFKCSECAVVIRGSFVMVGDAPLCQDCADRGTDACAICRLAVRPLDPAVAIGDSKVHATCFTCMTCAASLVGAEAFPSATSALAFRCRPCAESNRPAAIACIACGEPIVGTASKLKTGLYHQTCIACCEPGCSTELTGGYFPKNGDIYCSVHVMTTPDDPERAAAQAAAYARQEAQLEELSNPA